MPNIAQVKFERLKAQAERDIILNEIMKGTLVLWDDVKTVFGERVVEARNRILMLPSMYADRLSREEVEQFRKAIHEALTRVSKMGSDDLIVKKTKKLTMLKAMAKSNNAGDR